MGLDTLAFGLGTPSIPQVAKLKTKAKDQSPKTAAAV